MPAMESIFLESTMPRYLIVKDERIGHEIIIDRFTASVMWNGKAVRLTRQLYSLLNLLASSPYEKFTMGEIMKHTDSPSPAAFWEQIHRLRKVFNHSFVISHGQSKYSLLMKG